MSRVSLLGVSIDPVTSTEAVLRIRALLSEPGGKQVVTPNAEMLVATTKNPEFRTVLNHAALAIADSVSVVMAARLTGQSLPARVTGVDTTSALCLTLTAEHPVFFLGAAPGIAERAAAALQQLNPNLVVAGTWSGSPNESDAAEISSAISASKAVLLLVAFGSPAQELWIARYLPTLPHVRVAMGVGGTFDFLAGEQKRAPVAMQVIGLEWLWRLIREPRRWKRILNATIVFPFLILRYGKNAPAPSSHS